MRLSDCVEQLLLVLTRVNSGFLSIRLLVIHVVLLENKLQSETNKPSWFPPFPGLYRPWSLHKIEKLFQIQAINHNGNGVHILSRTNLPYVSRFENFISSTWDSSRVDTAMDWQGPKWNPSRSGNLRLTISKNKDKDKTEPRVLPFVPTK
jgi:uncharacterized protein (DUF952 family)